MKRSSLFRLGIGLVALGVAAVPAAADLLLNGSFEDPVVPTGSSGWINFPAGSTIGSAGWVVDQNSVDVHAREYATYWTCADGLQALDLTGGDQGIIHQDVAVTAGLQYTLSFQMSANLYAAPTISSLEVYADGNLLGQVDFDRTGATFANMNWQRHTFGITAQDESLRVEFRSLIPGGCGPAIDDVSLTLVPEPVACASVTGLALFGYGALRRRLARRA